MIITGEIYEAQGGLNCEILNFYCHNCGSTEKGTSYDYLCLSCENFIMKRDDEYSESCKLEMSII